MFRGEALKQNRAEIGVESAITVEDMEIRNVAYLSNPIIHSDVITDIPPKPADKGIQGQRSPISRVHRSFLIIRIFISASLAV